MINKLIPDNQYCDKVIWDSFKNGDREAFAIFYYRYFRVLIQNCFRFLNDINLIEDCIHDLFLEIWNNKINLVTPESVKAYLLCSTQRKIIKQLKKNRTYQDKPNITYRAKVTQSIEEQIISEQNMLESKRDITRALNALTKRQKEAVCLRYYVNLSYSEISSKMDISTDSVYTLVCKALDTIQKSVQKKSTLEHSILNYKLSFSPQRVAAVKLAD